MRVVYFLILAVLLTAIAVFALQNTEMVTINYLNRNVSAPKALVIAGVYLLGMISGWTVVGFFRKSIRRISERPPE